MALNEIYLEMFGFYGSPSQRGFVCLTSSPQESYLTCSIPTVGFLWILLHAVESNAPLKEARDLVNSFH